MTFEEYYGEAYPTLKQTEQELLNLIKEYQVNPARAYREKEKGADEAAKETAEEMADEAAKETVEEMADEAAKGATAETPEDLQPILYCKSRIKSPESMMAKLRKQGLQTDCAVALQKMHDAVGIRIVCSFVDDVYAVAAWLCSRDEFDVIEKKDYIA